MKHYEETVTKKIHLLKMPEETKNNKMELLHLIVG